MNNQREIYEALLAGETLVNNDGHEVKFSDDNNLTTMGSLTSFFVPKNWQIYKEPKWYDNIPKGGVLCLGYGNITAVYHKPSSASPFEPDALTPLTKQEIQVFMDNAPKGE